MVWVTIEGSIAPCVELPRGERRTVQLTDYVQGLISRGYVIVVDEQADDPAGGEDNDGGDGADRGQPDPERVAAAGATPDRAVDPGGAQTSRPRVHRRGRPRPRDAGPAPQ